jgi:hypothetical protein
MKLLRIVPSIIVLGVVIATGVAFADAQKGSGSGAGAGSGAGSAAPSGGTVADADVKRWLAFWDKLVDTFVNNKGNCPKMGTDINALVDASKDLIAAAQKAVADGKVLPADARQHMKDTAPKMINAAMSCANDAGVKAAMQRLKFTRQQSQ